MNRHAGLSLHGRGRRAPEQSASDNAAPRADIEPEHFTQIDSTSPTRSELVAAGAARNSGSDEPYQGPFHCEGRAELTQEGLCPLPDLSEMSEGVGFKLRYQMFEVPAVVLRGEFASVRISETERAEL